MVVGKAVSEVTRHSSPMHCKGTFIVSMSMRGCILQVESLELIESLESRFELAVRTLWHCLGPLDSTSVGTVG